MIESEYQARLIKKLKQMFPGVVVLKNDATYIQGIPDLSIFYKDRYAMLECKTDEHAPTRPNQPYYVELFNEMSFGAFIYPENQEGVLHDLQRTFGVSG